MLWVGRRLGWCFLAYGLTTLTWVKGPAYTPPASPQTNETLYFVGGCLLAAVLLGVLGARLLLRPDQNESDVP